MDKYVLKLCSLGIPACNSYSIVNDFLKNFDTNALEEYIGDLQRLSEKGVLSEVCKEQEGVDCVY